MSATRIVLIRHAEGVANVWGILGGHHGCAGLTDRGRQQARLLRDSLRDSPLVSDTAIAVTSRIRRAVETYAVVAPALADGHLLATRDCGLCDVHWGDLDGAPIGRLRQSASIYETCAPHGESWVGFMRRASHALRRLAALYSGSTVVAVTHGGVIKVSLQVFGRPHPEVDPEKIGYTAVTVWSRAPGEDWRLDRYGDSSHLGLDQLYSSL
jgi:2,3-bisphosphoglycerate-dependent phosphoglycerate mutase